MHIHLGLAFSIILLFGESSGIAKLTTWKRFEENIPDGIPVRLDQLIIEVLQRSPSLIQARHQANAAFHRIAKARGLEDLKAKLDLWNVPLDQPLSFGKADSIIVGLKRMFPPGKKRELRAQVALREFEVALEAIRTAEEDLRKNVKKAYAEYFKSVSQIIIHVAQYKQIQDAVDLTRIQVESSLRTQADLIRLTAERSMVQKLIPPLEARMLAAQALLNTLRYRPVNTRLGPPAGPPTGSYHSEDLALLVSRAIQGRSELLASRKTVERDRAALKLARTEGRSPDIEVEGDYWYNPQNDQKRNGYEAMVSMSLPWGNARHRAEVQEAEEAQAASEEAVKLMEAQVAYEVTAAHARLAGKEGQLEIIREIEIPQLKAAQESTLAGYTAGTTSLLDLIDARRKLEEAQLSQVDSLSDYADALADLERAVGGSVAATPVGPPVPNASGRFGKPNSLDDTKPDTGKPDEPAGERRQ